MKIPVVGLQQRWRARSVRCEVEERVTMAKTVPGGLRGIQGLTPKLANSQMAVGRNRRASLPYKICAKQVNLASSKFHSAVQVELAL
jgi:hypothetical protein